MKIKVEITLTIDEYTEDARETQVQIEEHIPEGFQSLDAWEQNVRNIGFRSMRTLFSSGIELYEEKILSEYIHKDSDCHTVKRGLWEFTLKTALGKVRFLRRRVFCNTCNQWITPIDKALGLHDDEHEKATAGFKELSCLCSVNQPYRQAADTIRHVTQDPEIVSHEEVRQIVQEEGKQVRKREEDDREDAVFCFVRAIQNRPDRAPPSSGSLFFRWSAERQLYICLDGTFVRSSAGKNQFYEGKVGFICTDARQSVGNRLTITLKRYISSFQDTYVFGGRVRGQALRMGIRLYREVFIIGDGARWIREIREQRFPGTIYILDWYHLRERLYSALKLTLPNDETRRNDNFSTLNSYLWRGMKHEALQALRELYIKMLPDVKRGVLDQPEGLRELIFYIKSNWEGIVDYQDMSQKGYLVASSLVEKAVDLVVAKRQKKSQGMHWSRMGADNICALRTLWLNGDWKDYWCQRKEKAA